MPCDVVEGFAFRARRNQSLREPCRRNQFNLKDLPKAVLANENVDALIERNKRKIDRQIAFASSPPMMDIGISGIIERMRLIMLITYRVLRLALFFS